MSVETDLKTYVLDNGDIAALIAARMYPRVLPQNVTYPAVSYDLVSVVENRDLSGPGGKERSRITIKSWSENYLQAKALAKLINARINPQGGLRVTVGSTRITSVRKDNEFDVNEADAGEIGTAGVFGVMQDFIVAHHNV